jgi:hypothetical protein
MQHFSISIPQPCTEDWNSMQLQEQGKFCGSCQKNVVDSSNFTKEELIAFFRQEKNKNTCGRFRSQQIKQVTFSITQEIFYANKWQQFLAVFCVIFGIQLFSAQFVFSQDSMQHIRTVQDTSRLLQDSLVMESSSDTVQKTTDSIVSEMPKVSDSLQPTVFAFDSKDIITEIHTSGPVSISPISIIDFSTMDLSITTLGFATVCLEEPIVMGDVSVEDPIAIIHKQEEPHISNQNDSIKKTVKPKNPAKKTPQAMNEMIALLPRKKRETEE